MTQADGATLVELVQIMRRLLAPDGCPWDREQTLETLRPYVIEEAHEVVDAIERGDLHELREELGDLLLQIVFQAELAGNAFSIDDVVRAICEKMVRRHPHVFGEGDARTADEVKQTWEAIKARERADRGAGQRPKGVLDGVPVGMPALLRALRMGEKAAHLGLDWPDAQGPRGKLDEELGELDTALAQGDLEAAEQELGDALFALANVARKQGIDPEGALRGTLSRFAARVQHVERAMRESGEGSEPWGEGQLDAMWEQAKQAQK